MKKVYFIVLITSFFTAFSKKSTQLELIVTSNKNILLKDTVVLFETLYIYEGDSLFDNLKFLDNFHFKKLIYTGDKRDSFPKYQKKVKELSYASFNSKKLLKLPSFIDFNAGINNLIIESLKFNDLSELRNKNSLKELYIYTPNSTVISRQLCGCDSLKILIIKDIKKVNQDLICIRKINQLQMLSIDIKVENLYQLADLKNLKELTINHKVTLKEVTENLKYLRAYKKINFSNFKGKTSDKAKVAEILNDIVVDFN